VTHLLILIALCLGLISLGILEYRLHLWNLAQIPVRIHVNGTRGKSSVTRLIAAGLRAHGIKVFAKTTGSQARVITDTGSEYPVYRPSSPNIIEQLRIVAFAAQNNATALVIECMALQPVLQSLAELSLIRATHGVITNARPDHLDVMGPGERDVALALLGTTPKNARLYTAERDYLTEFSQACHDRHSELLALDQAILASLTDQELADFSYLEHRENVALALQVCRDLGVPRNVALAGMQRVTPDIGAMTEYHVNFFGRQLYFVNGFAANDPESSARIWHMAWERYASTKRKIMIINTRLDRPDRSLQLGEVLPDWQPADKYLIIGSGGFILIKAAIKSGVEPARFIDAEGYSAEAIFELILEVAGKSALVMGIGNIKGEGLALIKWFKNRADIETIAEA
jgi:poly-gamma-glutamate synthase PgsB/CapB